MLGNYWECWANLPQARPSRRQVLGHLLLPSNFPFSPGPDGAELICDITVSPSHALLSQRPLTSETLRTLARNQAGEAENGREGGRGGGHQRTQCHPSQWMVIIIMAILYYCITYCTAFLNTWTWLLALRRRLTTRDACWMTRIPQSTKISASFPCRQAFD